MFMFVRTVGVKFYPEIPHKIYDMKIFLATGFILFVKLCHLKMHELCSTVYCCSYSYVNFSIVYICERCSNMFPHDVSRKCIYETNIQEELLRVRSKVFLKEFITKFCMKIHILFYLTLYRYINTAW